MAQAVQEKPIQATLPWRSQQDHLKVLLAEIQRHVQHEARIESREAGE